MPGSKVTVNFDEVLDKMIKDALNGWEKYVDFDQFKERLQKNLTDTSVIQFNVMDIAEAFYNIGYSDGRYE